MSKVSAGDFVIYVGKSVKYVGSKPVLGMQGNFVTELSELSSCKLIKYEKYQIVSVYHDYYIISLENGFNSLWVSKDLFMTDIEYRKKRLEEVNKSRVHKFIDKLFKRD